MGLIEKKVGDFSLGEAFVVGLTKAISERILAPVIGNGTLMSGSVKLVGAWAVPKYLLNGEKTKGVGKTLGTAWAVDGVEDIVTALMNGISSGNQEKNNVI